MSSRRRALAALSISLLAGCGASGGGEDAGSSRARLLTPSAGLLVSRGGHTATVLLDGRVLMAGGDIEGQCEVLDPTSGRSVLGGPLVRARSGHSAVLRPSGKVLLLGGFDGNTPVREVEEYDPDTGLSTLVGSLTNERVPNTALALPSGKVLVIGSSPSANQAASSFEEYDPETGSSVAKSADLGLLAGSTGAQAMLRWDGKVWVYGAQKSASGKSVVSQVWLYDPEADAAAMEPFNEFGFTDGGRVGLPLRGGDWVLSGGYSDGGLVPFLIGSAVTWPAQGGSARGASFPQLGLFHSIAELPSGRLVVAGGYRGLASDFLPIARSASVEIGELGSQEQGRSFKTGELPAKVDSSSATVLPWGDVLIAGGMGEGDYDPQSGVAFVRDREQLLFSDLPFVSEGAVQLTDGRVFFPATSALSFLYDPILGQFTSTGGFPDRARHSLSPLPGGGLLVAGGHPQLTDNDYLLATDVYDPLQGVFSPSTPLLSTRGEHGALFLPRSQDRSPLTLVVGGSSPFGVSPNAEACLSFGCIAVNELSEAMIRPTLRWSSKTDRVLVAGCSEVSGKLPLWVFDPTFAQPAHAIPGSQVACATAAVELPSGKVMVHGGGSSPYDPPAFASDVQVVDLATDAVSGPWAAGKPRRKHAAYALPSGEVLLLGGEGPEGALDSVERLDATLKIATPMPPLKLPRAGARAWPLPSGKLLVTEGAFPAYINPEIYDPQSGASELVEGGYVEAHGGRVVTSIGGDEVLVIGGALGSFFVGVASDSVARVDARGARKASGKLTAARAWPSVARVAGGLLVVGGKGASGASLASAELFDEQTFASSPLGGLVVARRGHSMTRLPTGDFLIVGGDDQGKPVLEIELFSPTSGASKLVGKLTHPRANHSAVLLDDGRLWVVGGVLGEASVAQTELLAQVDGAWVSTDDTALLVGEARAAALGSGEALVVGNGVAFLRRGSGDVEPVVGGPEYLIGLATMPSGRVVACGTNDCSAFDPRSRRFEELGNHGSSWLQGCATALDGVICAGIPQGDRAAVVRAVPLVDETERPVLDAASPAPVAPGVEAELTGQGFTGKAPASMAGLRPPQVLLLPEGGPPRMARVTSWTPSSVKFKLKPSVFHGNTMVYVSQSGVLSRPVWINVAPSSQGTSCASDRECASGFCSDGFCCNERCQGVCEACSAALMGDDGVSGVCGPIAEGLDPKGHCGEDAPSSCQRTGVCDGARRCQLYPDDTPCSGGICSQGSCLLPQPAVCDAAGERLVTSGNNFISCAPFRCREGACLSACAGDDECSAGHVCTSAGLCRSCSEDRLGVLVGGAEVGCGNYLCKHGECASSCQADLDCAPGFRCSAGACAAYCDEATNSAVEGSRVTPCGLYRCAAGACPSACNSNLECAAGQVCGVDGRCRRVPPSPSPGSSCSASPAPASLAGAWWPLLLAAALRRRRRAAVAAASLAFASAARAQPTPPAASSAPAPAAPAAPGSSAASGSSAAPAADALARAKEEFRKGVAQFEAGDHERALVYFLRSREAFASKQNTINAALSLDRLGRPDEAIELYEEVIGKFQSDLSDDERESVPRILAGLRAKVGELRVSSDVEGTLYIDGRQRGRAPTQAPLALSAGGHQIRVTREGYEPFEATIAVDAGGRVAVDAKLELLRAVGRLRVEGQGDVLLDGLPVGAAPWEGSLSPGAHAVEVRGDGTGSAPTRALIVEGQITLLRPRMGKLGPRVRVSVSPATAEITLDGVPLGRGRWEGSLPEATYELSASEEGYVTAVQPFSPQRGSVELALKVDEKHPRWPRRGVARLWTQAMLGYGASPSLRSGAEEACPARCPAQGWALGPVAGLRVGYELAFRLSLEVGAGYLSLGQRVVRTADAKFPRDTQAFSVNYRLEEERALRGPWVSGSLSVRLPLASQIALRARLGLGVSLISARSRLRGTASVADDEVGVLIPGAEDTQSSSPLFLWPEIGVESRRGAWRFGASLGLLFLTEPGPAYNRGDVLVPPSCSASSPGSVGCAPAARLLEGERSHGVTAFLIPQLSVARYFSDLL